MGGGEQDKEGPAQPEGQQGGGERGEGGVDSGQSQQLGGAPAVAPKRLDPAAPARPTLPHPGGPPSDQHIEAAEDAFTEFGLFEALRMRAYSHLKIPIPPIDIMPPMTRRSTDIDYHVKISAPNCDQCNERHALVKLRKFLELYPLVPFECVHGEAIRDLAVEEAANLAHIALPEVVDRMIPEYASESSAGSICLAKAERDLATLLGRGAIALQRLKKLLGQARVGRFDVSHMPQISPEEITRLIAIVEKGMVDSKADLKLAADECFDDKGRWKAADTPAHAEDGQKTPVVRLDKGTPAKKGAPGLGEAPPYENVRFKLGGLGMAGSSSALRHLRTSQEMLETDDIQFELVDTRPDAVIKDGQAHV